MSGVKYARKRDRLEGPLEPSRISTAPLVGSWINTNPESRGIVGVRFDTGSNDIAIEVLGAGEPGPIQWGAAPVCTPYARSIADPEAEGGTAVFDFGSTVTDLQANVNQGLLIVATLTRFSDGSGRANLFAREFFRRTEQLPDPTAMIERTPRGIVCRPVEQFDTTTPRPPSALDAGSYVGEWLNTDRAADGITRAVFRPDGETTYLRLFGSGNGEDIDWGEVPITRYAADISSTSTTQIAGHFDLDFMEVSFHGWIKMGVFVIALFNQFKDRSGRCGYFEREFLFLSETP